MSRLVFGFRIDDASIDETSDEVFDLIEGVGLSEEEWDCVVWFRRGTWNAVLFAPLSVKSALLASGRGEVLTPGQIAEGLKDSRNRWLYPVWPKGQESVDRAVEQFTQWQDQQWPATDQTSGAVTEKVELTNLSRQRQRKNRTVNPEQTQAQADIMAAFGLTGARDSNGRPYSLTPGSES